MDIVKSLQISMSVATARIPVSRGATTLKGHTTASVSMVLNLIVMVNHVKVSLLGLLYNLASTICHSDQELAINPIIWSSNISTT